MRPVRWEADALRDVERALAFVAAEDRAAALRIEARIHDALALLAERPIGRPTRLANIFQKLVLKTPYIIVYELDGERLTILRVFHQREDGAGRLRLP